MSGRKRSGRSALARLLAAAALVALPLAACVRGTREGHEPAAALRLKKERFTLRIPAKGSLESLTITPVAAKEVNVRGLTLTRLAPEGAVVKEGDLLASFDPADVLHALDEDRSALAVKLKDIEKSEAAHRAELEALEIDLEKARISLTQAETRVKRLRPELYSRHDILTAELDRDLAAAHVKEIEEKLVTLKASGRADVEMLRIDEKKLRSKIEDSEKNLDAMELRAPCPGVVIYRDRADLKVGDVVWPNWPFLEIHEPSRVRVKAFVLEQDAGALKTGQPAEIVIDAFPDRVQKGTLERMDSLARPVMQSMSFRGPGFFTTSMSGIQEVKYFEVALTLDALDPSIMKPGMPVSATIFAADIPDALSVPLYSVFEEEGASYVYLVGGGKPERRAVTLGARSRTRAVVVSGLEEGDRIAMRNPYLSYADFAGGSKPEAKEGEPKGRS